MVEEARRQLSLLQPEEKDSHHPWETYSIQHVGWENDGAGNAAAFEGKGFYKFLQTGLHSDLKVRDKNGHEWNVHKVVVAKFCNFFENALKGPCKESVTNVVEMTDDDPAALKALIEFLYVEDYDIMTATDNDIVLEFHLQVYIIATIYEVQSLRLMAFARFVRLLMTKTCPAPSLVSLLATAYANTRDSDKLLRPFVARLSIVHMAGLLGSQSNFLEVLVKYDDLRKDIARRMINMDLTTTCEGCKAAAARKPENS